MTEGFTIVHAVRLSGYVDGMNLVACVRANPLEWSDPSGLEIMIRHALCIGIAAVAPDAQANRQVTIEVLRLAALQPVWRWTADLPEAYGLTQMQWLGNQPILVLNVEEFRFPGRQELRLVDSSNGSMLQRVNPHAGLVVPPTFDVFSDPSGLYLGVYGMEWVRLYEIR